MSHVIPPLLQAMPKSGTSFQSTHPNSFEGARKLPLFPSFLAHSLPPGFLKGTLSPHSRWATPLSLGLSSLRNKSVSFLIRP